MGLSPCEVQISAYMRGRIGDKRHTVHILSPLEDVLRLPAKQTPSFDSNLISLSVLSDHALVSLITDKSFTSLTVRDARNHAMLYKSTVKDGIYPILNAIYPSRTQAKYPARGDTAKDWHEQLFHPGKDRLLTTIHQSSSASNLLQSDVQNIHCTTCLEAGSKPAPLERSSSLATVPLDLTHTDLIGPINPPLLQRST